MAVLTEKRRAKLKGSAFVFPKERAYPIYDRAHARAALARVAQWGTPSKIERVKAAIRKKFPKMKVS